MRAAWRSWLLAGAVILAGCPGDGGFPPRNPPGDGGRPDLSARPDLSSAPPDLTSACQSGDGGPGVRLPDGGCLGEDPAAPIVTILAPTTAQLIVGPVLEVAVRVQTRGRAVSRVEAVIAGHPVRATLALTAEPNVYRGLLSLAGLPTGPLEIDATAADLDGRVGGAAVGFLYDGGPRITIFQPTASTYRGSAPLFFSVSNPTGDARFDLDPATVSAEIEQVRLSIQPAPGQDQPSWEGLIDFHSTAFRQALSGRQTVRVVALSRNGARAEASVVFTVDEEGPVIEFVTPAPGTIVGGILPVVVNISDPAGVAPATVQALFAGDPRYAFVLRAAATTPSGATQFVGDFDTRLLPPTLVLPLLSVRAADTVGNQGEESEELIIDNVAPAIDLDPPALHALRQRDRVCSHPFDPVGSDATNDGDIVPQLHWLRARIEDRGNVAPGQAVVFLSLTQPQTTNLYVIRAADGPVIVDSDGDGTCDDVNPELVPTTILSAPDQAIVVPLVPIPVAGQPDFSPGPGDDVCLAVGVAGEEPPDPLCQGVSPVIYDLGYTGSGREPAIWSIPPIGAPDSATCQGLQFDAANSVPDGAVCVAARAYDRAGNRNVSAPLRLCLDKGLAGTCDLNYYQPHGAPLAPFHAQLPGCTGTVVAGRVDPSIPCIPGVRLNTGNRVVPFAQREIVPYR